MQRHWTKSYEAGVPNEIDPDAYKSLTDLIEVSLVKYADHTALECFGQEFSYNQVDKTSRDFAAYLQNTLGLKKGDRVALMSPNFPAFVYAMYGILRAGGVQVNVNPLYTPAELKHQLIDSGAETIVIYGGSTPVLAEILADTPIKTVITIGVGDGTGMELPSPPVDERITNFTPLADALAEGAKLDFTSPDINGDDIVFFQYTGGTTGPSKGAILTHRNVVAAVEMLKAYIPYAMVEGEEVLVGALPLYHIFGLVLELSYASVGAKNILIPNPRDMDGYIAAIKDKGVTHLPGVNTLFDGMLAHPEMPNIDFSKLKVAIGGGAAVLKRTSDKFFDVTGCRISEGYGLSETAAIVSINPSHIKEFSGTCGLPMPSCDVILLDDDDNIAEIGERGEVCVAGPNITPGYWNKPEANEEAFANGNYFRTGDIGTFDEEGYLRIVDRKKDMIIVSGFNVFPNEIEAAVSDHPDIVEVACIGVPDDKSGEAVKVFAVIKEGSSLTADDVKTHCRGCLTGYKIPRHVVFIAELPKSAVGKILRRELRDV